MVQEVEKLLSNQKVASVLEQDTEPLIAPDVQCAISVNVKCVYIVSRTSVIVVGEKNRFCSVSRYFAHAIISIQ